jgi:hypothetical protein
LDKISTVKTKSTAVETPGMAEEFASYFRASLRELSALHRANKADEAEIRRLQSSTRKKLDRIRENLGHAQAAN